ncbi:MAG: DUF4230 domain-containing protein [Anaerolineales bacterium]|nr:DUF4230 domain-containing protein [Anaerolineales bacterium]
MKKTVFLILIVLLLSATIMVVGVNWSLQRATAPVEEMRQQISTQVSAFINPTPTIMPDPITIVHELRPLARLETMQYSVEKVITAETGQGPFGFLFGDRLLLVAHGTVIAGVDLDKLGRDDIKVDAEGRVTVALPAAEVFITSLDNERSYVYDRDIGLLRKGDVQLESAARLAAEQEMLKAAIEDGILDQAQTNAENYLYRLLRSLGFSDVTFTVGEELD